MNKKEEFKNFVSGHPELLNHVKSGNMTWQKFYEIYDLYGSDETKWQSYFKTSSSDTKEERAGGKLSLGGITELIKKADMSSIQKHINTAQKAINLFQEFGTKKGATGGAALLAGTKGPTSPRPINKFFED